MGKDKQTGSSQERAISTNGGTYIEGTVDTGGGAVVGRDQVTRIQDVNGPISTDNGDAVDLRESRAAVYKPSGPVTQHFGQKVVQYLLGDQEARLADLLKRLESSLGLLVTTIIAVALIAGSMYLFFATQSKLDEVDDSFIDAQEEVAEAKAFYEMVEIRATGWFSDTANVDRLVSILEHLRSSVCDSALDKSFALSTLDWCSKSVVQLNSEKGLVGGFVIRDELVYNQQQSFISQYDTQISLLNEITDMVRSWAEETAEDRDARFDTIDGYILQASSLAATVQVQAQQIVYEFKNVKLKELDQLEAQVDKSTQLQTRRSLAIVGIIVGSALIVFPVISAMRFYFKSEQKHRTRTKRVDPARKRRRKR